jgi:cyclic dehypoxanthinyl futalosine synthase
MLEENVVSSAGARHRSNRTELIHLIRTAGRTPAQRDTLYNHLVIHDDPANDPTDDLVVSHFSSTVQQMAPTPVVAEATPLPMPTVGEPASA